MTRDAALSQPLQSAELEAAKGTVRDALGALRNLWELSKSVKVGPKALRAVIPDVLAACGPMLDAFEKLLAQLPVGPEDGWGDGLRRLTVRRIEELEHALIDERRRPLKAAERLSLERTVVDVFRHLDVGLMLVEIVYASRTARQMILDICEMVREAAAAAPEVLSPSFRRIPVELGIPKEPLQVAVNARAVMSILTLIVGLVAGEPLRPVSVRIFQDEAGNCRIDVAPDARAPNSAMAAPVALPATWECANTACANLGVRLERSGESVTLHFPPSVRP